MPPVEAAVLVDIAHLLLENLLVVEQVPNQRFLYLQARLI
jgi:hypothetical protein